MPKILLVEDNEMNRDMLARRLRKRGFDVVVATDGEEGVSIAHAERPELILMDMSLPVLDGWEATRTLKGSAATRHIPLIALTAHAMTGDREKAIEAGCDDFDTKPVDLKRLLGKIEGLLNGAVDGADGADGAGRLRHDLRTPLTHMLGYAEMLIEEAEHPELHTVVSEGRKLLGLVSTFLEGAPAPVTPADLTLLRPEVAGPLDVVRASAAAVRPRMPEPLRADVDRIVAAAAELDALLGGDPASSAGASRNGGAGAGELATVLVVDDNPENRDLLARRLEREGYRVRVAEGGHAALEALDRGGQDLVLLDVMMPDLDGVEVLRRIKADPRHRDLPVLMISALDEIDTVVRSIELGAEDYLPKPFNPVLLRARIGACLEKKRLRDQEREHQRRIEEWNQTLERRVQEQVEQLENLGRLKRFFSPQLAERILAGGAEDPLRTHRREITVVFLDLRGFTHFAETSEPEEIMGVLREYHREVGEQILAHEGTLERFTGDGLMVFFNDPIELDNPAERAVRMALAMRERVARLQEGWRRRGHDLGFGVGIARGYATLGAIGFEGRWDYAAIGTVTNLAARLCAEAQAGQILISRPVAAAVEDIVALEPLGGLNLRGLVRAVDVFSVMSTKADQATAKA